MTGEPLGCIGKLQIAAAIQAKSLSADTFRKNGYAMKREGFFGMDSICSGIFKIQSQHC